MGRRRPHTTTLQHHAPVWSARSRKNRSRVRTGRTAWIQGMLQPLNSILTALDRVTVSWWLYFLLQVFEVNSSHRRSGKQVLQQLQEATQSHQVSNKNMADVFSTILSGENISMFPNASSCHKKAIKSKTKPWHCSSCLFLQNRFSRNRKRSRRQS